MRRSVLWSMLALILWTSLLSAQWQKQGVASGTVNDILRMRAASGTEDFWWLATAGGVFSGRYPTMDEVWMDQGAGVYTPLILKVDGYARGMGTPQMKVILTEDGVYARLGGTAFLPADAQGLANGYTGASDVAVASNLDGTNTVYLAFNGGGVWKRGFCGDAWCAREKIFGLDTVETIPSILWNATGLWHQDRCGRHSGLWSWKAGLDDYDLCNGSYPESTFSTLTMATPVDLGAAGHGNFLRFWDRTDTDYSADRCIVQVCDELGSNCVDLDSRYGQSGWENRSYDLGAFDGLRRIRFVFQSDNLPSGWTTVGWFIDDIEISRDTGGGAWEPVLDASLNAIPNPFVSALYVHESNGSHTVHAATLENDPSAGDIYVLGTGNWTGKATPHYSYLSIDGPDPGSNRLVLAGTAGHGVMSAPSGGNFTPFCDNLTPPAGEFIDVSVDHGEQPDATYAAVTTNAAYRLDPLCPPSPYLQYTQFALPVLSVLADCSNSGIAPNRILAGTAGLGLMALSCTDSTSPPVPVAAEGQATSPLTMKSLSRIAVSVQATPTVFAASPSDGLYKSRFPVDGRDYFVRHFYDPATQGTHPGTAVVLAPGYDDTGSVAAGEQRVYLGTAANGIFRSDDGGSSWMDITPAAWSVPRPSVVDLVVASGGPQPILIALTATGQVWTSPDGGLAWTLDGTPGGGLATAHDLAVSPSFAQDGTMFAATSAGLYKRFDGIWEPAPVLEGVPVLSVAAAPLFNDDTRPSADYEVTGVLAGTKGYGVWYSFSWGDMGSFTQVIPQNPELHHLTWADVPILAMHPATDLDIARNDSLYHCFVSQHPSALPVDGVYCMSFLDWYCSPDPCNFWEPFMASGTTNPLPDARITDLAFHPAFRHLDPPSNPYLYAAHQNKKLFKGTYDTVNYTFTYDFQPSSGFYHTPPYVYAIAESPDIPGAVLAGTKGYGPMMSFDGGVSYYPWPAVQKDGFVLHDIFSAAFTQWSGTASRLLISAGDPALSPVSDFGIFYQDYAGAGGPAGWSRASLCLGGCTTPAAYSPANFDGHQVLELRYINLTTDILASDFTAGPLKSDPTDPNVPGALGKFWQVDASGTVPASLSDISPLGTGSARALDPRGMGAFIWGAQGTLSHGFTRSNIPGAYRYNPNLTVAAWEQASGTAACALPPGKNWRAVLASDTSTALIGARDGAGVYRTDNADAAGNGAVCWQPSDTGMNPGDRDFDYTEYSKRVTAFVKASNGILAAMEEEPAVRSGTGGAPGGVFFSDASSGGRAWVPVQVSVECPSSYELAGGSRYYTGTTCDGIYAAAAIAYTGQPTALFLATPSTDPWHENRVIFTDHSAGNPASRSWDFGDGSAPAAGNPVSHDYDLAFGYAMFTPTLTSMGQMGATDAHMESVELVNTLITGIQKVGEQILVTWAEVSGGGHTYGYQLRKAAGAEGGLNVPVAACVPSCAAGFCSCQFEESDANAFYKILTSW